MDLRFSKKISERNFRISFPNEHSNYGFRKRGLYQDHRHHLDAGVRAIAAALDAEVHYADN